RPGVLEELGLVSALTALITETPTPDGLTIRRQMDKDLPELDTEAELVVYRIAQEALTNTVRHAGASRLELSLRRSPCGVELRIRDDGRGLGDTPEGAGLRGMRERALLIGAELFLGPGPQGGTEVRLDVPVRNGSR
ncbi:sensor histidine kinase, partial [Streptomyces fulvissimus]|nr:sensor histidine kinase [Streptomyces microflavus]